MPVPERKQVVHAPARAGEKLCKVTCRFELKEGEYSPSYSIYNSDLWQNDYDWEDDDSLPEPVEDGTAEFMVPPGTYDVYAACWVEASADESNLVLVIREDVRVDGDMSLTINTDEATENISFTKLLPDGEPMRLPWLNCDGSPVERPDGTEANIAYWYGITYIWNRDAGIVNRIVSATDCYMQGIVEPGKYKLRINRLSDDYHIFESSIMNDDAGNMYLVRVDAKPEGTGTFANDVARYVPYSEDYVHTPVFDEQGKGGDRNYLLGFRDLVDGVQLGGVIADFVYDDMNINVCAPQEKLAGDHCLDMMLYHGVYEGGKTMVGLPVRNVDGTWEHVNNNHSEAMGNWLFQVPSDGSPVSELPGHPSFSYRHEDKTAPYGNSAPICSTRVPHEIYENGVHIDFANSVFIGRLGEVRNQDLLKTDVSVFVDGQTAYSGPVSGLEQWQVERGESAPAPAKVRMSFHNGNVRVDDMPGFTLTEIGWDEKSEDHTPPTVQMLMFKDNEGRIIDRFGHPSQGVLEFSAADFNYNGECFESAPVNVAVMCAPTGVDDADLIPIEVQEIPDLFMMPNFGYFYRGTLEGVTAPSPDGWYDLVIILEDMSGNTQMQYLSPAFRIEDNVSAPIIGTEGISVNRVGDSLLVSGVSEAMMKMYSPDGRLAKSGSGTIFDISDLPHGVYIVTVSSGTLTKTLPIAL